MLLTFNHVDIEASAFSWFYFCFPDEISNSKFWNLKNKKKCEKNFFSTKIFFSKHFSSVNKQNMEKIHTLKKICFDPKISFFNFLCARTSPKNAFFDFYWFICHLFWRAARAQPRAPLQNAHQSIGMIK